MSPLGQSFNKLSPYDRLFYRGCQAEALDVYLKGKKGFLAFLWIKFVKIKVKIVQNVFKRIRLIKYWTTSTNSRIYILAKRLVSLLTQSSFVSRIRKESSFKYKSDSLSSFFFSSKFQFNDSPED